MRSNKPVLKQWFTREDRSELKNQILQMYATSFNQSKEMVYIIDQNQSTVYFNQNFNHLLGYKTSKSGQLYRFIDDLAYPDIQSCVQQSLDGIQCQTVLKIKSKQKTMLTFQFTFTPIHLQTEIIGTYLTIQEMDVQAMMKNLLSIKEPHSANSIIHLGYFECDYSTGLFNEAKDLYGLFPDTKIERRSFTINDLYNVIHENDYDYFIKTMYHSVAKREITDCEFRIVLQDNHLYYIRGLWQAVEFNGKIKLVGIVENKTSQMESQNQHDLESEHIKYVYDHLGGVIWTLDCKEKKFSFVSSGTEKLCGLSNKVFLNDSQLWFDIVHPEEKEYVYKKQQEVTEGHTVSYQCRIRHVDGYYTWVEVQAFPRYDFKGELYQLFGFVQDITETKGIESIKEYNANHDNLTGLYNRAHFYRTLHQWTTDQKPFALLYVDFKRFQQIYETLGFQISDDILKQLSGKIGDIIGDSIYCARISGGSFAILLKDETERNVYDFTEELLTRMDGYVHVNEFEIRMELSAGISFYPNDTESPDRLIQLANLAMQRAKEQDHSSYQVYYKTNDLIAHKRYELEKDLRNAVENHELTLYYQPRVRPADHAIVGLEALIRWEHPTWGVVNPNEFIPLAEESHLILDISEFVLEEACRQLHEWKGLGIPYLIISVNISPLSFIKKGFIEYVQQCLNKFDIDGKWLEIEITETTLIKNEETTIRTLEKLREMDIQVALDDFGTGYSSLKYLTNFPIDTIKIDKSFIDQIGRPSADEEPNKEEHLVAMILYLAKGLQIKVVAEGVETKQQLTFIEQKECQEVQGYLYSPPLPTEKLMGLLKSRKILPKVTRTKPKEERRKFYRFEFDQPLHAQMMIKEVKGKKIAAGRTKILIKDLSIGGLKFVSSLNIPVRPDVKMEFEVTILGETFSMDGQILWKNEMNFTTYDYGVQFTLEDTKQDVLAEMINKMSVYKRNGLTMPDTPIIYENPHSYIHKQIHA
ncbi:EAL domain-containing protein [Halobacillus fulvus]|nr:EAL domain-containing protein [Halobacillus fulvus]